MNPRFTVLALALGSALVAAGCSRGGSSGSSGGGGPVVGPTNTPPSASVNTPAGLQAADIVISYTLTDPEADSASITVDYSVDGGGSFFPATAGTGGDGTTGLTTSAGGLGHTFVWASRTDSVALAGPVSTVQIRITPADAATGTSGTTGNFTVSNKITAFRITDLRLRDPHAFFQPPLSTCQDGTDSPITTLIGPIASVNQQIANAIAGDTSPADGYYDLSLLLLFRPLDQGGSATGRVDWAVGRCAVGATTCDLDPAYTPTVLTYTNAAAGTLLSPVAGTTSTASYSPSITLPTGPGFSTPAFAFTFNFGLLQIPLTGVRAGAAYGGNPATSLQNGLLMGFLSEAVANTVMISTPIGLIPLSSLLPGGTGCCAAHNDKDVGPDGTTVGWWFYFNFTATEVTYTGP